MSSAAGPLTAGRRRTRRVRWLAGASGLRIVLAPAIMALVAADGDDPAGLATLGGVLFCAAAATDLVDGRLARRWGATSIGGAFLDTTADKILVASVLIALVGVGRAAPWAAAIIVSRELLVLGLRGAVALQGTLVAPSTLARGKTTVQFLALALAIVRPGAPVAGWYLDEWVLLAAVVLSVASGAEYVARFAHATVDSQRPMVG